MVGAPRLVGVRFLNTPVTDLTYDDAFLVPSASEISSRFDTDLSASDPIEPADIDPPRAPSHQPPPPPET